MALLGKEDRHLISTSGKENLNWADEVGARSTWESTSQGMLGVLSMPMWSMLLNSPPGLRACGEGTQLHEKRIHCCSTFSWPRSTRRDSSLRMSSFDISAGDGTRLDPWIVSIIHILLTILMAVSLLELTRSQNALLTSSLCRPEIQEAVILSLHRPFIYHDCIRTCPCRWSGRPKCQTLWKLCPDFHLRLIEVL